MKEYNYFKAPISVAERIGVADMRNSAGDGFVILSQSDMRMLDLTMEEKASFFGCEECDEEGALVLIEENKDDVEETEETVQEGDNPAEPESVEGEENE